MEIKINVLTIGEMKHHVMEQFYFIKLMSTQDLMTLKQ